VDIKLFTTIVKKFHKNLEGGPKKPGPRQVPRSSPHKYTTGGQGPDMGKCRSGASRKVPPPQATG